jgi:hypothetical protein
MSKISLKDRMAAGVAQKDKFSAADLAMSSGTLSPSSLVAPVVRSLEVDAPPQPNEVPTPFKTPTAINAGIVKGARVTRKTPKGESVIIRETFSLPPDESCRIDGLRMRAAQAGVMLNRSEVVRAGIAALAMLNDTQFSAVTNDVPKLKTGRPSV